MVCVCGSLVGGITQDAQEDAGVPTLVKSLEGEPIVSISAGQYHSAAVSEDGLVFAWGKGEFGRLGSGGNDDALSPQLVMVRTVGHVVLCTPNHFSI